MLDYSTYLLYRAASAVASALPLRVLFSLGEFLGLLAWAFSGKYRRLALHNLAIAFENEKSASELRRLTRRHFRRLGANLLSSVKLGNAPLDELIGCVSLENANVVEDELRRGRGLVVVLSHLGNWELFAQVFPKYFGSYPLSTVYQSLGNSFIDADVKRKRARAGLQLFDRREGFQPAIALLRAGGVIGILGDQHAGDHGLWTPFFGRLASTTPLPALLAKRTGTPVIAAAIFTEGVGRWRMSFTQRFDATGDTVQAITAKANTIIADQIRTAPEDWFWVHNRWKTPKPNFLLARYKRGVYVSPELPDEDLKPFRILIRGTNWLGDSVISAAAVRAIKLGRPDAHITVAAPAKLAAVWKLIPEVDEVLPLDNHSLGGTVRLLKRQTAFDVALLFPNSLRSALEVWLAGIPRRVGYRGHHRAWLLNQVVPEPSRKGPIEHQVHRYLHLASTLGAADGFHTSDMSAQRDGPLRIGLCPGAEYGPAKRWLPEKFAEVAVAVSAQRGAHWMLFGTESDTATGNLIAGQLEENCTNRIAQTSLDDLISELRECCLLLTNDTGTMHLATLLGVPVVAIFGSTEDRLTGPLGSGHIVVRHHVECSPCFLRECPLDLRCMKAVSAEEVTAAVLRLLDNSVTTSAHSARS